VTARHGKLDSISRNDGRVFGGLSRICCLPEEYVDDACRALTIQVIGENGLPVSVTNHSRRRVSGLALEMILSEVKSVAEQEPFEHKA
jgi:hypothetical protein